MRSHDNCHMLCAKCFPRVVSFNHYTHLVTLVTNCPKCFHVCPVSVEADTVHIRWHSAAISEWLQVVTVSCHVSELGDGSAGCSVGDSQLSCVGAGGRVCWLQPSVRGDRDKT